MTSSDLATLLDRRGFLGDSLERKRVSGTVFGNIADI